MDSTVGVMRFLSWLSVMPRGFCGVLLMLAMAHSALAVEAHGQVVRGSVRSAESKELVAGALVTLVDSAGRIVAEGPSSPGGRFVFSTGPAGNLRFVVRKLGVEPTATEIMVIPPDVDTVTVDLIVPQAGVTLATVSVTGRRPVESFNAQRLREARRSGWRVTDPEDIAVARATASSLGDLIRRVPLPGVIAPNSPTGCFRYIRNNRCLTIVLDGTVYGQSVFVPARDVYFVALLTPSQAVMQYGERTRDGALAITTRMYGDLEQGATQDSAAASRRPR